MAYLDEEILKQQKAEEQAENKKEVTPIEGSVAEGKVILEGKEILFERKEFLEGQLSLFVPTDIRPMTEEEITGAYLLGNRPQFLFHSEQTELSFVLNHTENPVQNGQIIQMAGVAAKLLERATMNGKIFKKINFERDEKMIATVELVSNGFDDGVYSLNFYISLQERLLLGNWNCPAKKMQLNKELAMQMIETMEIKELEKSV